MEISSLSMLKLSEKLREPIKVPVMCVVPNVASKELLTSGHYISKCDHTLKSINVLSLLCLSSSLPLLWAAKH